MLRTGFTPTEFTEYPDGFSVTFKFKEPIAPGHIVKLVENTLTPRQKEIAEILKTKGPMNINSIGDQLKKHVPERTLRHELSSLKKLGILITIGNARNTLWGIDHSAKENI